MSIRAQFLKFPTQPTWQNPEICEEGIPDWLLPQIPSHAQFHLQQTFHGAAEMGQTSPGKEVHRVPGILDPWDVSDNLVGMIFAVMQAAR